MRELGLPICMCMSYLDTYSCLFSGVDEVCPLGVITFNCTVTDVSQAQTTRWIGDSPVFNCTTVGNIIALTHDDSDPNFMDPVDCGAATGQVQSPVGDMYTSVLTVEPTLEMGGSKFTMQCAFPRADVIVINYTASVIGECYVATTRTVMLIYSYIYFSHWYMSIMDVIQFQSVILSL